MPQPQQQTGATSIATGLPEDLKVLFNNGEPVASLLIGVLRAQQQTNAILASLLGELQQQRTSPAAAPAPAPLQSE